jgi:hypothetical protein
MKSGAGRLCAPLLRKRGRKLLRFSTGEKRSGKPSDLRHNCEKEVEARKVVAYFQTNKAGNLKILGPAYRFPVWFRNNTNRMRGWRNRRHSQCLMRRIDRATCPILPDSSPYALTNGVIRMVASVSQIRGSKSQPEERCSFECYVQPVFSTYNRFLTESSIGDISVGCNCVLEV